jgi:outer membrane protein insertion porin family
MDLSKRMLCDWRQLTHGVLLLAAICGSAAPTWAQELGQPSAAEQFPQAELVSEIRILGNDTVPVTQVEGYLSTRVGRPFDRSIVQSDVRRLANLGLFIDVKSLYETTPQGRVVIFQVVERPTIRYVSYLGNEKVKDKKLAKETALKAGGSVDPYAVEEGRRKIKEYYATKGYGNVQVTVMEGSKPTDQGIVYLINEGVSQKVWDVEFIGNEFVSDGRLKTIVKSKPPIMMVFKGYLNRDQLDTDVEQLTAYYRSFGFFQAKVSRKIDYNEAGHWANLTFVIDEGMRYNIRDVKFLGNTKFEPNAMASAAKLSAGQPFEQNKVQRDTLWLQELYGSQGYVFADVRPEPVFLEEPGQLDLLYHIDEGERFRVGRIFVHIGGDNPHTRIQTALNRMTLRPGDIMDIRELKASERRLLASSLFHTDAQSGVRPKITYRIPEDADMDFGAPGTGGPRTATRPPAGLRGQSPDNLGPTVLPPPSANAPRSAYESLLGTGVDVHVECEDLEHYKRWLEADGPGPHLPEELEKRAQELQQEERQQPQPEVIIRGQSPTGQVNQAYSTLPVNGGSSPYGGTIVGATGPTSRPTAGVTGVQPAQYSQSLPPPAGGYGPVQGFPANPVPGYQVFPDGHFGLPGQPYPEQTVDIFFDAQETQTGRLMLGVGVNSDAGVVGNIVLDERNFDWRRPPTSWEDLRNGTGFRGAGQRFRIDASPGSEVNRYLVSFQEPYLFDSPISLGLSGSYFDRRFRDYDEQRLGGRVSLGYQWVERDVSSVLSYRGESVEINNAPNAGLVPDLAEVLGENQLHGFKATVINDTRDSAFLPTQGHYLEMSGEYVTGTFDYPRVEADFRQYWLVRERPDHSGRHVVSFATALGWLGDDAPIYDRFYAGGFSTMRGFEFRGASPIDIPTGVQLGGDFQWLNSVQYLFPITADDMLHGVVFCDFGTVEPEVQIEDFRVAPGVGLRISVPAMGPAPIALDFAWAVDHADFDDREVFSFSLGFSR